MTIYYVKITKDGNVYDCGGFQDEEIASLTAKIWESQGMTARVEPREE